MCTKKEVHIFNMWTIIMQSFDKKEWKLLELQITQLGTPKVLRKDERTNRRTNGRSGPTTRPAFAKVTQEKNSSTPRHLILLSDIQKEIVLWNTVCLFVLMLYIPVYNFSVMLGQFSVFLGWTSSKQCIKCLVQGHNTVNSPAVRLDLATLRSQV